MFGDKISIQRNRRDIILIKSIATYLYERKVVSIMRDFIKILQGRLCVSGEGEGEGEGREGETLTEKTKISKKKVQKSIT